MDNLKQLLARYGRRPASRYWIGELPDVRDGQMKKAVLSAIGYPNVQGSFDFDQLKKQDWSSATRILAFTGTRSLVWDLRRCPSASSQADALKALRELDGTAQFFSNGDWGLETMNQCWCSVSQSTFDAGLIGYDSRYAFAYWVEEED